MIILYWFTMCLANLFSGLIIFHNKESAWWRLHSIARVLIIASPIMTAITIISLLKLIILSFWWFACTSLRIVTGNF